MIDFSIAVPQQTQSSLSLTLVDPHILEWSACLHSPQLGAFSRQLHKAILYYIIDRAVWERRRQMLKATSNCRYIRIQVRSPHFWPLPYSVGDCRQSCPFTSPRNLHLPSQVPNS